MTHGSKVVYFIWTSIGNNGNEIGGITEISIMEKQFYSTSMAIFVNVINATCVK